jgi:hypothetical protein
MKRVVHVITLSACALLVAFGSHSQVCAEDLIERRVRAHPSCQPYLERLSPEGRRVWQALSEEADRLGRMPSLSEYTELLVSSEGPFTTDDRVSLYFCFGEIQEPRISKGGLYDLLRAQRVSIASLRARYSTDYRVRDNFPEPERGSRVFECEFAFDGQKAFFEKSVLRDDAWLKKETEAYDGEVLRTLLEEPDENPYGTIGPLDARGRSFVPENPMWCAGLVNSVVVTKGEGSENCDLGLAVNQNFVYEIPATIRGIECLPVGQVGSVWYCSLGHQYALVEKRIGDVHFDEGTQRYVRRDSSVVHKNSEFAPVSDQVLMPKRSEYTLTREGQIVQHFVTTVSSYELNEDVSPDLFSEIIPQGAYLVDALQDAVYVLGEKTETKLNMETEGIKPRRSRIALILLNVLAVFVLAALLVFRRRKLQSQNR